MPANPRIPEDGGCTTSPSPNAERGATSATGTPPSDTVIVSPCFTASTISSRQDLRSDSSTGWFMLKLYRRRGLSDKGQFLAVESFSRGAHHFVAAPFRPAPAAGFPCANASGSSPATYAATAIVATQSVNSRDVSLFIVSPSVW